MNNIFSSLPEAMDKEIFETLIKSGHMRIERIISHGQSSPEHGWYDQDENEWVMILSGSGTLGFENGSELVLEQGDYLNIPAHTRHRVIRTAADKPTIWLAVFY